MAMMACGECKREVSSTATACPHCGAPVTRGSGGATSAARIILMVIAICSILPALAFGGPAGLIVPAVCFVLALALR